MAQINVEIAGRTYRMACNDGEEDHLRTLAARFDGKIHMLRGTFGEIGDSRITMMAALTIADQLSEAERRVSELEAEIERLRNAQAGLDAQTNALAETVAAALGDVAARVDKVAHALNAAPRD